MSEIKPKVKPSKSGDDGDYDDSATIAKIKKHVKKDQSEPVTPPKPARKDAPPDTSRTKKVKKEEVCSLF
jgi:hypothetical protein